MIGIVYDDAVISAVFMLCIILFVVLGIVFAFKTYKIIKSIVGDLKGNDMLHKIIDTRKEIQKRVGIFMRIELTIVGILASYYLGFIIMLILSWNYGVSDIPCLLGLIIIPLLIFPQIWVKKKKRFYAFVIWLGFMTIWGLLAVFLKI